jgi:hypothetical protein
VDYRLFKNGLAKKDNLGLENNKIMGTIELKSNIHKIVDGIQNEQLLQTLYDFLKSREKNKSARLWDSLTEEQKQEVILGYEESEDDNNLLDRDEVFKSK